LRLRLAFLLLAAAAALRAEDAKLDARIFDGDSGGSRRSFLVVLREQADLSGAASIADRQDRRRFVFDALTDVARRTQAPLLERARAAGAAARAHYLSNFVEIEGDADLARELAARPDVSHVAANRPARLFAPERIAPRTTSASAAPESAQAAGQNLALIGAPALWARGITGDGVVIGDADTGFAWEHPAIRPRYRGTGPNIVHAYNWHDAVHDARTGNSCGSDSPAPCDDNGHGTSTSGLTVGDDGQGNQVGVAPGARLIGCRNMDQGVGTPARYTECFEFFLAPTDAQGANPRPDLGADVISNSWGCPPSEGCTDPQILRSVVENVRAAGIVVVVSAGNGGSECETITDAPAIYESAFTVGATDNEDEIASFSSRGPIALDGSNRLKPDVVAPGVNVRTAARPDLFTSFFTGTSASAPHVAGAVALIWQALPALRGDPAATEDLLRGFAAPLVSAQSCEPFSGDVVPNAVFGFGRIDVLAAVDGFAPPPPRDVRPPARRNERTKTVGPRRP
jgi:subtilisin family serine protease